jgi:hypothetical protein
MSDSYTSSGTGSYTEAEIKAVLGKVYDDFLAIDAREFDLFQQYPNFLKQIREDLYFLLERNSLREFQIQFTYTGGKAAIHYKVHPFGSIYNQDSPSGGTNYYQFPKNSSISIIARWNDDDSGSNEYMESRGWTGKKSFLTGTSESRGDYTSGNLSMNKSIVRS